jgi:hypothetical protein
MTVSAPVRLMPTPPERVDRMKQKYFGSVLKRCIMICRGRRRGEAGGWAGGGWGGRGCVLERVMQVVQMGCSVDAIP